MRVADLLASGKVIQDPDNADQVIYSVPLYLPKSAIDAGGFEMFATGFGWLPDTVDATPEQIAANDLFLKCNKEIGNYVRSTVNTGIDNQIDQEAFKQKQAAKLAMGTI